MRQPVIHVLVVSESQLHGEGLALRLSAEPGIEVVGLTQSTGSAVALARARQVEIVLVDLAQTREHQCELAGAVRTLPQTRFVTLVTAGSDREVVEWAEAGAAIADRRCSPAELSAVLASLMRGQLLCSPGIAGALLRRVQALSPGQASLDGTGRLTRRESEVLSLLSRGMTNKQIAAHLALRLPTVKNHVHNLFEKLDVHSRAEAVSLLLPERERARSWSASQD